MSSRAGSYRALLALIFGRCNLLAQLVCLDHLTVALVYQSFKLSRERRWAEVCQRRRFNRIPVSIPGIPGILLIPPSVGGSQLVMVHRSRLPPKVRQYNPQPRAMCWHVDKEDPSKLRYYQYRLVRS